MTDLDAVLDRIEERQKVEGQVHLSTNGTSLDLLQAIYRDPRQPIQRRMKVAEAALPYEHWKRSVKAEVNGQDLAEQLMRAIEATHKVFNARPMQMIEPPKVEPTQVDQPLDHSGPFAVDNKSRFRWY
jgi:hypothetical protein